jgi:hypothetical protein
MRKNSLESHTTKTSETVIEGLLRKPSKKPNFNLPTPKPGILSKLDQFLPDLKKSTE